MRFEATITSSDFPTRNTLFLLPADSLQAEEIACFAKNADLHLSRDALSALADEGIFVVQRNRAKKLPPSP